jgi:hypothetical protein
MAYIKEMGLAQQYGQWLARRSSISYEKNGTTPMKM